MSPLQHDVEIVLGTNVAYDTPDLSDQVEVPGRLLVGVDTRVRRGALRLGGEFIYQDVEGLAGSREGGYATVGYDLSADDRALVRLDSFRDSEQVLLGYNRALTRAASFQANLVVPLDERAEPLRALANFQLAF